MKLGIVARVFHWLIAVASQASPDAVSIATSIDPRFQRVTLSPGVYGLAGASQMVLQPDGKVLIGGVFSAVNGQPRTNVARLNSDGTVDLSFVSVTPANASIRSLVVQQDGKILVVVFTDRVTILRLNPDGTLDSSFTPAPETANWSPDTDILVSPSDQIYVAGPHVIVETEVHANRFVARLSHTGSIELMLGAHYWCGCGMAEDGIVRIAFQPDSKIIVGGYFSTEVGHRSLARFNIDGTEDLEFNSTAVYSDLYPYDVIVQRDGKVVYSATGGGAPFLTRYNANGTLDRRFIIPANVRNIRSLAVQADGKLIGIASYINRLSTILRFNIDGTVDTGFSLPEQLGIGQMALQPDGRIVITALSSDPGSAEVTTTFLRLRGDPVVLTGISQSESEVQFTWKILDATISYRLESSVDLKNWSTNQTFAGTAGAIEHREARGDTRFFRVIAE